MLRLPLILLACLSVINVFAQSEMSVFTATGRGGVATTFVTDYQSIGINPANLGWSPKNDKKISLGLLEMGFSIYSDALVKSELTASLKKGNADFTIEEKAQAAKDFTDAGLTANIDIALLSLAVQPSEKVGGFAFGIKERFQWHSDFSKQLSEILFLGYNSEYFTHLLIDKLDSLGFPVVDGAGNPVYDTILNEDDLPADTMELIQKGITLAPKLFSEIMDGSRMSMSWYREYNLSYGRMLLSNDNLSIYAGVGLKYLVGLAIIEARIDDGTFEAYSAITPALGIDYGDSAQAANPSSVESGGIIPKQVGSGMGFDFGVSVLIGEKLKLGAAVNDIGSITWDGNVYQVDNDSLLNLSTAGFGSYNILVEAQQVMGDDGMFDWSGVVEKKVSLATNVRFGGSFMVSKKLEAGLDIIIPLNDVAGSYGNALIGLGVDFIPIPWLQLNTGITTGGNYGFNLPIGVVVMIGEGAWSMGVASRDAVTFFSDNRPTLSLSMGFLRFRF